MSSYPEGEFLVPLFPLPNVVFFPRTRLPLHVFEPRYRQMVTDALAGEERIGMILLKPGWETDYYGAPPVYEFGTLGLIEQAVALQDGRYNMLLNGTVRFKILEHVQETPYRVARVIASPEAAATPEQAYAQREWLVDLSKQYLEFLPGQTEVPELETASLDSLTNALVMSLALELDEKQRLLEIGSVVGRSERVGELLREKLEALQFLAPYRKEFDPSKN